MSTAKGFDIPWTRMYGCKQPEQFSFPDPYLVYGRDCSLAGTRGRQQALWKRVSQLCQPEPERYSSIRRVALAFDKIWVTVVIYSYSTCEPWRIHYLLNSRLCIWSCSNLELRLSTSRCIKEEEITLKATTGRVTSLVALFRSPRARPQCASYPR